MNREEEIIAGLISLGKDKKSIGLGEIGNWVRAIDPKRDFPDNWKDAARRVIRTMRGLGLVEDGPTDVITPTAALLNAKLSKKVKDAIVRASDAGNGDRGNDGLPPDKNPPANANNGDDSGGGAGFREVLGHPYLFAIPEEDFNDLIESIG